MSGKLYDKIYNVGIYLRLSKNSADYTNHDSDSIENQQAMLSKFIDIMPGWIEKQIYIDNGSTGAHFQRQGFQDMITDVRNGIINLVLVSDLSRIGRNYLGTGKYLEEELPALGCRFVALSDGIDTAEGENDIMPFLNAMNDFYLKNISDRIKLAFDAKAKAGHKLTGIAPYGYRRNPEQHTMLIVDDTAIATVKWIFEMRANGFGYGKIVAALNGSNIPPPKLYYNLRENKDTSECSKFWGVTAIPKIVRNEIYCGHTISKRFQKSYRSSKVKKRNSEEWVKVENTHEAIIHKDLWDKVQEVNNRLSTGIGKPVKRRTYLFSSMLCCADCKVNMMPHAEKRFTGKKMLDNNELRITYSCKTYQASGKHTCSRHNINEEVLEKIVLENIKSFADCINLDEESMLTELKHKLLSDYSVDKVDTQKLLMQLKQELYNLDLKLEQLYDDKITGAITSDTFGRLASNAELERNEVAKKIDSLELYAKESKEKLGDIETWIRLIKENSNINEVNRKLLDALVERVEVGESTVENGVKTQNVRIIYKFVGEL